MELVFVFFFFIEIFKIYFFQVVKIVFALLVCAFVYGKEGPVFFGDKAVTAMRAFEFQWFGNSFSVGKGLAAYLALVLAAVSVVIVNIVMRSIAYWTGCFFWYGLAVPALNWFYLLLIFPFVVSQKKLPVLFDEWLDYWKLVCLEFLIFW